MLDPKKMNTPKAETNSTEAGAPAPVGFGAHSERYRARWVANHPDMRRNFPVEQTPSAISQAPDAASGPMQADESSVTPPVQE